MRPIGDKLVIATHNPGKLREIAALIEPLGIKCVSAKELDLPEPDEIGNTFVDNADLKAREAADLSGLPALAVDPIRTQVAAVSCGIHQGTAVLDLDYDEDSQAGCDGNFVLTADGSIVEAQVTAEGECYDEEGLLRLLRLARIGCGEIFEAQRKAVGQ